MNNPQPPQTADSIQLLKVILDKLEVLAKSGNNSKPFFFMWGLFKRFYLSSFMPVVKALVKSVDAKNYFDACPISVVGVTPPTFVLNISICVVFNIVCGEHGW